MLLCTCITNMYVRHNGLSLRPALRLKTLAPLRRIRSTTVIIYYIRYNCSVRHGKKKDPTSFCTLEFMCGWAMNGFAPWLYIKCRGHRTATSIEWKANWRHYLNRFDTRKALTIAVMHALMVCASCHRSMSARQIGCCFNFTAHSVCTIRIMRVHHIEIKVCALFRHCEQTSASK